MSAYTVRLSLALFVMASRAQAQGYYNLDAGRPLRVEDAAPTPRYDLDLQLFPLRFEQLASGVRRWRTDPKLSFGVAPFTELELRAPILAIDTRSLGNSFTSGLGGLAVGGMHAFGLETSHVPAVAVAGEWVLPVGSLAARVGSYSAKLVATKTFELARVHANVGYGSWSVRPPAPASTSTCPDFILAPGSPVPAGCVVEPTIPDTPCDRLPSPRAWRNTSAEAPDLKLSEEIMVAAQAEPVVPAAVGPRWMSSVGIDHAFALSSALLSADVVAERYIGLFPFTDWSGELGVRYQWSPQVVFDFGIARHFTGTLRSNAAIIGVSYDVPLAHEEQ